MSARYPGEDDLAFRGVAELARLLEDQQVSSAELVDLCHRRLEHLGPRYNAVATLTPQRAKAEAQRASLAKRPSRPRSPQHGSLHDPLRGIPYGAKDLLAARGAPTTWGAPPYRDQVFDYDATVIEKLGRAGAVLAGKLAMVELAGGGGYRYPSASLQGPGRNPWNLEYWSGGSSSGSGAAVAAGLVPFTVGSETSGSIITPASYCGVTGLRPTYGLVSRYGAMALSWTLDKLGPMARSAEDCALVLQAMAGPDRHDPTCAGRRFHYDPLLLPGLQRLRLGYAPADFQDLAAAAARPAFAGALDTIRTLGARFTEVTLPGDLPYGPMVRTILGAEGATIFAGLIESQDFELLVDEKQKAGLRADSAITAREYLNAMRLRALVQDAFRHVFEGVDVLIGVGRPGPATRVDEPLDGRPSSINPPPPSGSGGNPALIAAGNLAGLPALCLPCGFTPQGLPLAIQLVGRPFEENTLLSLGAWYQTQTDWHRRRPPGLDRPPAAHQRQAGSEP